MKRFRAPKVSDAQLDKVVKKIYDDLNTLGRPITSEKRSNKASRQSEFRFVRDKSQNEYAIEVLFPNDGWVRFTSGAAPGAVPMASRTSGPSGVVASTSVNQAFLDLSYYLRTTARLEGFVDTIPINQSVNVTRGQRIRILDMKGLYSEFFTVAIDQNAVSAIQVLPRANVRSLLSGSYVDLEPYNSPNPIDNVFQVGRITTAVAQETTTINVEFFVQVIEGTELLIPNLLYVPEAVEGVPEESAIDYFSVVVGRTQDYSDPNLPQGFNLGFHTLPINPSQYVEAAVDTPIYMSGVELLSFLHVEPGRVLINVERSRTNDAIGRFDEDRSGSVNTISLDEIAGDIPLYENQQLWIFNKLGLGEKVFVNGDQTLSPTNTDLAIKDKILDHSYEALGAWIREADWSLTGRITVQAGLVQANATNINDNSVAISALTLDTTNQGVAIANLQTSVATNQGNITTLSDAQVQLESNLNNATATLSANFTKLDTNTRAVWRKYPPAPTTRQNGDPLRGGDGWIDPTDGKNQAYIWNPELQPPAWEPTEAPIRSATAQFQAFANKDGANALVSAQYDQNGVITALSTIRVSAGADGGAIVLRSDIVDINGIAIDSRGLIRNVDFDVPTYGSLGYNGTINTDGTLNMGATGQKGWAIDRLGNGVVSNWVVRGSTLVGNTHGQSTYSTHTINYTADTNINRLLPNGAVVVYITSGLTVNNIEIRGIERGYAAQKIIIVNATVHSPGAVVTLRHQVFANIDEQIKNVGAQGSNVSLFANDSATLIYDNNVQKWRVHSVSSGAVFQSATWGSINGTLSSQTDLQNALNAKANSSHNHSISEIAMLGDALDGKSNTGHLHDERYYRESEVDTLLSGKANSSHSHNELVTAVSISGSGNGTVTVSLTRVGTNLSNSVNLAHTHSATDINSGTLPVARGGTGKTSMTDNRVLFGNGTAAIDDGAVIYRSGNDLYANDFILT